VIITKKEFVKRVDEINFYFNLLENIEKKDAVLSFPREGDRQEPFNVKLVLTLKSAAMLLLYNLVESTVSNCLNSLHQTISEESCNYEQLIEEVQKVWLKYQYKVLNEQNNINTGQLHWMIDILISTKCIELSLEEGEKLTASQFSGNLDDKEVVKIAKNYKINFDKSCPNLTVIKNKRNQLAHGELSFADSSTRHSIQYMEILKNNTVDFMQQFMDAVEDYIAHKRFKR
jgi:hypothetical protein